MTETYTQTAGGYFRNSDGAGPYYKDEDGSFKLLGGGAEVTDERIVGAKLVGYDPETNAELINEEDTIVVALGKNRACITQLANAHNNVIQEFIETKETIESNNQTHSANYENLSRKYDDLPSRFSMLENRLDALEAKE